MKHSIKVTLILLGMFFIAQLIGLLIVSLYQPTAIYDNNGNVVSYTNESLPFGFNPPEETNPYMVLTSIIFPLIFAVVILLLLMKFKIDSVIRGWFFVVIILALSISMYSFLKAFIKSEVILYSVAILISLVLAYYKVFRRNLLIHNLTELLIYPGIAVIFISLINFKDDSLANNILFGPLYKYVGISAGNWGIITVSIILILISLYDMYAVWHAGFMQKMAKYQIKTVRVFSGFYVPYLGKNEKEMIAKAKKSRNAVKNVKVNIAILGGGDVVFPLIMAGVVYNVMGIVPALAISVFATLALSYLFYKSEKGKFYPAMPFISVGCFVGLGVAYLVYLL